MPDRFEPLNEHTRVGFALPDRRYDLMQTRDGRYASVQDGAVIYSDTVDDSALWLLEAPEVPHCYKSVYHNLRLDLRSGNVPSLAQVRGPHERPSRLLGEFRKRGWVCLPGILDSKVVDGLQQVAGVGQYSRESEEIEFFSILRHEAVAHAIAEPVSLWLMRGYLQTDEIRLAHSPTIAAIGRDDGQRDVQGWHSDYPYQWGTSDGNRVPQVPADLVLGIQRNVCITEFTKQNGATVFKLGSHAKNEGPPAQWGDLAAYSHAGHRAEHGLPYGGPDTQVIEAPAGSIILYDARTWHRQGINLTDERRAAMLQAVTPMYVMPFLEMGRIYKAFVETPFYTSLNERERRELKLMFLHTVWGSDRAKAIGADKDLTQMLHDTP